MKKLLLLVRGFVEFHFLYARETFPVNDIADPREGTYAFTNATIVKDPQTIFQSATLVIKDGKVVAIGTKVTVPKEAVVVDCKNKYIYPSFIDIYSDYGTIAPTKLQEV